MKDLLGACWHITKVETHLEPFKKTWLHLFTHLQEIFLPVSEFQNCQWEQSKNILPIKVKTTTWLLAASDHWGVSQKATRIYFLIGPELCHSVHFADQHFHLIFSEVTKVQDANNVRVLQLAGGRQDLVCEKQTFWAEASFFSLAKHETVFVCNLWVFYLAWGVTLHWG